MSQKILLIEDEEGIIHLLNLYLKDAGYDVIVAKDGADGLALHARTRPDLVILDIMLPALDGFEVCRRIRAWSKTPIMMLTARGDENDRILGLDLGADDYLVKPFSPRELVSRVRAILRRVAGVTLTPTEFDLLALMAQSPDRVYTREMLMNKIWGYDYYGDGHIIDVHISALRKKIEANSEYRYIKTVWSVGYKFEVEARSSALQN